jgi:hypothetical protein
LPTQIYNIIKGKVFPDSTEDVNSEQSECPVEVSPGSSHNVENGKTELHSVVASVLRGTMEPIPGGEPQRGGIGSSNEEGEAIETYKGYDWVHSARGKSRLPWGKRWGEGEGKGEEGEGEGEVDS